MIFNIRQLSLGKLASRCFQQIPLTSLIREAAWLIGGVVLKMLIQIGTLYYLTHNLGVKQIGVFFALISFFTCVVPFVQLGNYDLTVRQIARNENPAVVAGRAMRSTVASFLVVLPIVLLLKPWLVGGVSWPAFLLVAASEMFFMRVLTNVVAVATGFRLHYVSAISDFVMGLSRFLAVFSAAQLGAELDGVFILYAFATIPATLGAYMWLVARIGKPIIRSGPIVVDLRDHITMVLAWFAEMLARDGDKMVLAHIAGPLQTGIYGTAMRLFGITLVPIDILTQVFRPRLSQARAESAARGAYLRRMVTACLTGCGAIAGIGLFAAAYFLPLIAPDFIKSDFAEVRSALIYLAFVPPLYGLQRANAIDAVARGAVRAYAVSTAVGATCSISLLIALSPSYGWRAACLGSLVYFAVSGVATWVLSGRVALLVVDESQGSSEPLENALLKNESEPV
jgi:O-antigen/teichoic acid export membrane protein